MIKFDYKIKMLSANVFEIIFNIIRKQNKRLINDICENEGISYNKLKKFIPSKSELRKFIRSGNIIHSI